MQKKIIIRKGSSSGSCFELGELVSETKNFYNVVVKGLTMNSGYVKPDEFKRVSKEHKHLEPCQRCEDSDFYKRLHYGN